VLGVLVITTLASGDRIDQLRPSLASYAAALLQFGWLPVVGHWDSHSVLLVHCWSLAVEWTFYTVWPWLLWWGLDRRRHLWREVVAGSLAVWLVCALLLPWDYFYASPLARAAQLGVGCALALYEYERGDTAFASVRGGRATTLFFLCVALIGGWAVFGPRAEVGPAYRWGMFALVGVATAGLIVTGFRSGVARTLLGLRMMRGIGRASYSIYLWHVPLMLLISHEVLGTSAGVTALLLVASTTVAAGVSYALLERPYFRSR
jgi:peptidoglycan/LPS O-acetylase OafA/YrhL